MLKVLVSLLYRFVASSARIVVDRQTDRPHRPSTVTLTAHVRQGLMKSTKVETLGAIAGALNIAPMACAVYTYQQRQFLADWHREFNTSWTAHQFLHVALGNILSYKLQFSSLC